MLVKKSPESTKHNLKLAAYFVAVVTMAVALFLSATDARATELGHYKARLKSTHAVGGEWNNLGLALMGWSCYGTQSVVFNELLADHKGRLKDVPRKVASDFQSSIFSLNSTTTSEFDRDMNMPNASLVMSLRENCTKTELYTDTEVDSDGNTRTVLKTRTLSAWMEWTCDTSNLPEVAGRAVHSTCTPGSSYFGDFSFESLMVNMFRQKTFDLDIELQKVEEKYLQDFCGSDRKNRVVIGLKQGVGGHTGEDDFVFHVKIDGTKTFDVTAEEGILNEEIAYCGAGKTVDVEVTATEVDAFFDDQYNASNKASFTRGAQLFQKRTIDLTRDTYFGELFTDKASGVAVTLREAP